uniref:Uncharacterized protein n=1 Tax=Cucumis melo TaxID=3656 RepID=A0A9I9E259_CUCME
MGLASLSSLADSIENCSRLTGILKIVLQEEKALLSCGKGMIGWSRASFPKYSDSTGKEAPILHFLAYRTDGDGDPGLSERTPLPHYAASPRSSHSR